MKRFDVVKKLMTDTINGLELKRLDDANWDIGGVNITIDHQHRVSSIIGEREVTMYVVTYGVSRFSANRMEPDDVDMVEVGQYGSLEAAIPVAIQVCIQWALDNADEAWAEHQELFA